MSLATWDKITGALGSTTTSFGGNWGNLVSDFLNGINVGLTDPTKLPRINTLTRFKFEKLGLFDADESHEVQFSVDDIDTGPTRKVKIRRMNNPFESDYMLLEGLPQTILNKSIDADSNTITNIDNNEIKAAAGIITTKLADSTNFVLTTRTNTFGDFNQVFRDNRLLINNPADTSAYTIIGAAIGGNRNLTLPLLLGNDTVVAEAFIQPLTNKTIDADSNTITNIENADIKAAAGIVTTKLADSANFILKTLDNSFGAHYYDITKMTAPGNPAANDLRIYVDTADTHAKIKNSAGTVLDLHSTGGSGEVNTNTNVGTGAQIAKAKVGVDTPLRSLIGAGRITTTQNTNDITIDILEKYGPFLYYIYIDAADSKFKAINLSTNVVTDSGSTTDARSFLSTVLSAASTAKKAVYISRGDYPCSSQLDLSGLYLTVVMERSGGALGGTLSATYDAIIRKNYAGNTSFILISSDVGGTDVSYSVQKWVNANIKGDGDGNAIEIIGHNQNPDLFSSPIITNFKEGIWGRRCWEIGIQRPGIYNCSEYGIHLSGDPTNPTTTQCVLVTIKDGNFRINTQNVYVERATQTKIIDSTVEGATGQLNSIEMTSTGLDTEIRGCSFESAINAIDIIKDAGMGTIVTHNRFGGTYSANQNIYHGTSTCNKATFKNNNIDAYTTNATATVLLDSGSTQFCYGDNKMLSYASGVSLVFTDNSGNSTTHIITPNFSNNSTTGWGNINFRNSVASGINKHIYFSDAGDMAFQSNGVINFLGTPFANVIMDSDTGTGAGIKIYDVDYTHFYKLGTGNLTADRRVGIPDMTADGDLLVNNTSQTVTNKSILASDNTLSGILQNPLNKRWGTVQAGSGNTVSSVGQADGMGTYLTGTGAGTDIVAFDTTEGKVINYVTSAASGVAGGLLSGGTGTSIGRRLFGGKIQCRVKIDSTTTARFYFGLTSATSLPFSDSPLGNTDNGIIVGFNTSDTNYQVRTNDGATSVTTTQMTGPVAKTSSTSFHTIEISWTAAGNYTVTFDGTAQTISADLPATTADLFLNLCVQTSAATARTLTLKSLYIEADK